MSDEDSRMNEGVVGLRTPTMLRESVVFERTTHKATCLLRQRGTEERWKKPKRPAYEVITPSLCSSDPCHARVVEQEKGKKALSTASSPLVPARKSQVVARTCVRGEGLSRCSNGACMFHQSNMSTCVLFLSKVMCGIHIPGSGLPLFSV